MFAVIYSSNNRFRMKLLEWKIMYVNITVVLPGELKMGASHVLC